MISIPEELLFDVRIGDFITTNEGRQGLVTEIEADESGNYVYTFIVATGDLWTCGDEDIYQLSKGISGMSPINHISCKHKWKTYIGLTETFNYCEYCDERQDQ